MKKLYWLIVALFFTFYSCNKVVETHYPDGTVKSRQEYKGKKEHGLSTWFFNNGRKELEVNYKDGIPDGLSIRWYYSGQKETQEMYSNGKKSGPAKKWDLQGRLVEEINFLNDSLHGPYILYHENGNVKIEGFYTNGLFDSTWTYYDMNGIKVGDGKYKAGKGFQKAYYPDGKVRLLVPYENNKRNGYEIQYDRQGNEVKRTLYQNDVPVEEPLTENQQ